MPRLRSGNPVIAIEISDIHLSDKAPVARSGEPDWYKAMARPLKEVSKLARKYSCPVVCAGDIFHKWDSSAALINFALHYLPDGMLSIPGQHDLPLHNYTDIKKSAYWTLVKSGKIRNLQHGIVTAIDNLRLYAFPWGFPITKCPDPPHTFGLNVAVIHHYVWIDGRGFPGAPEDSKLSNLKRQLKGYDHALFGDNHLSFRSGPVFNPGSLMRRASDQSEHRPVVGLLRADGTLERHYSDTRKDVLHETVPTVVPQAVEGLCLSKFVRGLQALGGESLCFEQAVRVAFKTFKVSKSIKRLILQAMEKK